VKIVIDSYAWIELFLGSSKGSKVKEIIENADEVYTPDIVLAEIARKYTREGAKEEVVNVRLEQINSASKIVYLDNRIALESAKCYIELLAEARERKLKTPSLFDAIILATGRVFKAKVLTGDQHFHSLPETTWV
jgi:predicted nucleic acid-binding protein